MGWASRDLESALNRLGIYPRVDHQPSWTGRGGMEIRLQPHEIGILAGALADLEERKVRNH